MHSENGLRHLVGSFPERAQAAFWVAEDDGVVAWCFAHRRWHRATDNGYVWLGVLPASRGRGVGTALWQRAEEHLDAIGVARINADVVGDEAGARFLEQHGFAPVRTVVISAVDPRGVDGDELAERRAAAERSGYRLAPYAEVDVHALFALELSLSADEPGEDEPRQLAKLAQLRWAAANGIDRVVTDNDNRNAPMLAINRRLGYEPFTERRGFLKER